MKKYHQPAIKVKQIDMKEALLETGSVGQGNKDHGGGFGGAKDFTFDDEEEDESNIKSYNPWE